MDEWADIDGFAAGTRPGLDIGIVAGAGGKARATCFAGSLRPTVASTPSRSRKSADPHWTGSVAVSPRPSAYRLSCASRTGHAPSGSPSASTVGAAAGWWSLMSSPTCFADPRS